MEQELHRVEYTLPADEVPEADIAEVLEYTRLNDHGVAIKTKENAELRH